MILWVLARCGEHKPNVEDLPEGTVTMPVGIPQNANVSDYGDNALTKYLEEKANVELKFVFFFSSVSEYRRQLALMCSANE